MGMVYAGCPQASGSPFKSFNLQQYSNHTTLHFYFRLKTICTFICWIKEMQFHLKNTLTNLGMILLLSSCTGHQPGGLDEPASLFPVPLKVPGGYLTNRRARPVPGKSHSARTSNKAFVPSCHEAKSGIR
jgi:hypothetical protein